MRIFSCILISILSLAPLASGVVTVNGTNIIGAGANNGLYIVDGSNVRVPDNTLYWSLGTFSGAQDFGSDSASTILSAFSIVSSISSVTGISQPGLFGNSVTYNGGGSGSPASFVGSTQYVVIANASDILSATEIAVFDTGNLFVSGDNFGNGATSYDINLLSEVVYGVKRSIAPSDGDPFSLAQSVQLTSIPEASSLLLCGLGSLVLLRRRRND